MGTKLKSKRLSVKRRRRKKLKRRNRFKNKSSMHKLSGLNWIAIILLIIGGLNWGLVGLFDFDLLAILFGENMAFTRVLYALIGLAGVYAIFILNKLARK